MFMDPNQDDMVSIDTGLPIKKSKTVAKTTAGEYEETTTVSSNEELPSTTVGNINKMDGVEDDVVYDDDKAKEEALRFKSKQDKFGVRKALIEALEGAKHVIYKRSASLKDDHGDFGEFFFIMIYFLMVRVF